MDKNRLLALQAEWEGFPETEATLPERLPLNRVVLIPSVFQCRSGANDRTGVTEDGRAHAAGLTAELKTSQAKDLDRVLIIRIGGRNVLVDGHHRFAAYKSAKRSDIPVSYFSQSGGPKGAVKLVGMENRKAKLTMSSGEKLQWAWELVCSEQFTKSELREATGASDGSIGAMRRVLNELKEAGETIPERWNDARPKTVEDDDAAALQARDWAAKLTEVIGPAKSFKTLSRKAMLADALRIWSSRIADELVMLMAEDSDLTARVNEMHEFQVAELAEERMEQMVLAKADELLRSKRYVLVDAEGVPMEF